MWAIYRNELNILRHSIIAYVFAAFLLAFTGLYVMIYNLNIGVSNFEFVLSDMAYIFIIAVPILTMHTITQERKQKTDQLLYSLPVSMSDVVIGKYLALLTVFAVPVLIICIYPLILSAYGDVYLPASYGAVVGFFFLGSALLAIGVFISSLSESQAVSAAICFAVMLLNYFLSDLSGYLPETSYSSFACFSVLLLLLTFLLEHMIYNELLSGITFGILEAVNILLYFLFTESYQGLFASFVNNHPLFEQFANFTNGVFDITSLIYLLSVEVLFVYLAIQSMEKRRWS